MGIRTQAKRETPPPKSLLIDNLEVCRLLGVNPDTWRKRVETGVVPRAMP